MDEVGEVLAKFAPDLTRIFGSDLWVLKWGREVVTGAMQSKFPEGSYTLMDGTKTAASFKLVQMPGCCGICISTGAFVYEEYRGKGLGTLLNKLRIEMARQMGYGILMCTDVAKNKAQRKILTGNDWQDILYFTNPRTKNDIYVSVFDLTITE